MREPRGHDVETEQRLDEGPSSQHAAATEEDQQMQRTALGFREWETKGPDLGYLCREEAWWR